MTYLPQIVKEVNRNALHFLCFRVNHFYLLHVVEMSLTELVTSQYKTYTQHVSCSSFLFSAFTSKTESSPTMYFYDKTRKYFPRKSGWIVCVCVFCCFSFILIFLLSFPPGRHSSITLKFTLGVLVLKLIIKQHDFLK